MKITEIAFAAYPVTDLKRARAFYEGTLGLRSSATYLDGDKGWIEYDIAAGTLAITNFMPDWKPGPGGGAVGLEVADFAATMDHLKRNNVALRGEPFETPVCHMAVIADPDGNSLTIHKRKS